MRTLFLTLTLMLITFTNSYAEEKPTAVKPTAKPNVIVLVLSGLGLTDKVAINYNGDISRIDVQKDLSVISKKTGWQIRNLVITEPSKATQEKRAITTARFEIISVVDTKRGLLPVEPFVIALKRFKSIQIDYIIQQDFSFRGLSNYEDDNARIDLTRFGKSYQYRIYIKNSGFDTLNLPRTQSEYVQKIQENEKVSHQKRIFFAVIFAIICALAAYFITVKLTSRQRRA